MPSKNYTLFFILSVGFVLLSIAFITILGQTSSTDSVSKDIRAKATVQNSMQLTGTVSLVDAGSITVDNVRFADNDNTASMGTFTAYPGSGVSISNIRIGSTVRLSVDASTFDTQKKTFTVLRIN